MKRPKLKKASKRVSCSMKFKIQKKVREHHKKLRKEAKKKGVSHMKQKKDLGVPNKAPFKEELLREAEQKRLQIEEEKEKKKQAKKEARATNKRKKNSEDDQETPKSKKARTDEKKKRQTLQKIAEKSSKKFLCAELNKVIDAADVILEVLDARDPMGYRCPQLEEAVLQRDGNKKLIFVLTKIDLVPKENVEKWIQCLQQEFPVLAFKSAMQLQDRTVNEKKNRIAAANGVLDKSRAAQCLGNSCLLELLEGHLATLEKEGMLKVGVVGFPNVGKSSLINSVKGIRACMAGVQRGITKTMQDVHISRTVKLLDSPGIVASPSNTPVSMALRSLQVEEGQESVQEAVRTLLKQCDKNQIMLQYNIPDFRNHLEFLSIFAKKRGYMLKGGVLNTDQAADAFLNDWTGAKLSYHCKAPETCSPAPYLSEAVVTEMQKGWDLDKLKKGNEETIKGVRCPNKASSIGFLTKGPSAGLLNVFEIPADKTIRVPIEEDDDSEMKNDEESEMMNGGLEDILEQPEEEEQTEELQETPVKNEPTKVHFQSVPVEPTKVQFQSVPVDVSLTAVKTDDDAYDFNTDFK